MTLPTDPGLPTQPAGSSDGALTPGPLDDTPIGPNSTPVTPPLAELPPAGPPPSSSLPVAASSPGFSIALLVGIFVLALIGIGLLGTAIFAVARLTNSSGAGGVSATATLIPLLTKAVVIPTTTPAPPATATGTAAPTQTAVPATTTPAATSAISVTAATATVGTALATVLSSANVRSGPGVVYAVVGSLKVGDTAPLLGRDASAGWLLISYKGAAKSQGWVLGQLVSYSGDAHSLPVVAAPTPLPPPPTPTAVPAGNPNGGLVTGARGVSGNLTLCSAKFNYAVGERVCFVEWIHNNTGQPVSYGVLGVQAVNLAGGVQFQTSWSGEKASGGLLGIDPSCTGPTDRCKGQWEDGIRLNTPGTYQLTLNVCFTAFSACPDPKSDWEVLSGAIKISVN